MSKVESYKDLKIWQIAMGLLPESERFGLVSQANRAAVSIPSNIAEGWGRGLGAAQASFLRNSRGSRYELETLVHVIERLALADATRIADLYDSIDRLGRKLNAYLTRLQRHDVREELGGYVVDD